MDTRVQMRHMDRIINIVEMMRLWSEQQLPRQGTPASQPKRDYWLSIPTTSLLKDTSGPLAGLEKNDGPSAVRVNMAKTLSKSEVTFEAWKRLTASTEYPGETAITHITHMGQIYGRGMLGDLDEAGNLILTEVFPRWIEANLPEATYKSQKASVKKTLKSKLVTEFFKGFFNIAYPLYVRTLEKLETWDRDLPQEAAAARMSDKATVVQKLKR